MQQRYYEISTSSSQELDLVRGFKTIAVIREVLWHLSCDSVIASDQRINAILSATFEDEFAGVTSEALMLSDQRVISQFGVSVEIQTSGLTSMQTQFRDILREPVEVVAPITLAAFVPTGTMVVGCRVFFDIVRASSQKITQVANSQGLQMEV